ncbi:MAG: MFS transporter [Candidatus Latescibacteria bacterium]|nr:MFS transporter [Candidatus Latescibacterota bacterium]NIO27234.1 MFS transporter [Candidatus Latescibacterota bacterium]NIO54758.1 MFS transporter [Candidatus Latescibacterota bacterium]NIT00841.1 MFS transporter [Candidatus Latescibacterota bacterium]NIT37764.1 MFS transporter [Candidatus Latescibacterota bacterium]
MVESIESRYFRRNFYLGIANGTLVNFGMAFVDPFTVLPVFVSRMGGSSFIIGLVSAIHGAGWFFPQVFVSRIVETRMYLLGIYRNMAVLRILAWAGATFTIFYVDPGRSSLFLTSFIMCFLLTNVGAGVAAIPFLEITSKTIPVTQRGRFFGTRRFSGGVLGIFAGVLVGVILNERTSAVVGEGWLSNAVGSMAGRLGLLGHDFPINYGILFVLGGVLTALALLLFCFVGEVPAPSIQKPRKMLEHLMTGFSLILCDRNYRLFYIVRICWQFTAMAFPFYSTYAVNELGFSEASVGVFVSLWVGSGVISNYIWGRILDRKGNKLVLIITAGLSIVPPAIALVLQWWRLGGEVATSSWIMFGMIASTFFINGLIRSGRFISNITYLLEVAPAEKRPLYVGFMNSFTFPLMLSPALGGLILNIFGVAVLFSAALFFALCNLVLSTRLHEPRI